MTYQAASIGGVRGDSWNKKSFLLVLLALLGTCLVKILNFQLLLVNFKLKARYFQGYFLFGFLVGVRVTWVIVGTRVIWGWIVGITTWGWGANKLKDCVKI